MFKLCIKNYFKSFKHFFTPLGTMFLGLLLGISVLVPGVFAAINNLITEVKSLAEGVNFSFETFWQEIRTAVSALNWNDPETAIRTILDGQWLKDTLNQCISASTGVEFSAFTEQLRNLVDTFIAQIGALLVVFVVFFILSFIVGFCLVRFFIRRDIAKRSLWKWFLSTLVNSVLTVGTVLLVVTLYEMWKPSAIFSFILVTALSGVFALTQAYLVYAYKKVKFSQVLNFKNAGLYLLSNIPILTISLVIAAVAMWINTLMGVFVGLAILEIALCVISMNAESYVKNLADNIDAAKRLAAEA